MATTVGNTVRSGVRGFIPHRAGVDGRDGVGQEGGWDVMAVACFVVRTE